MEPRTLWASVEVSGFGRRWLEGLNFSCNPVHGHALDQCGGKLRVQKCVLNVSAPRLAWHISSVRRSGIAAATWLRVHFSTLSYLQWGGKHLEAASNIVFRRDTVAAPTACFRPVSCWRCPCTVCCATASAAVALHAGSAGIAHLPALLCPFCSNGLLDPWSGGGVLHNISEANDVVAVIIPEGALLFGSRARKSVQWCGRALSHCAAVQPGVPHPVPGVPPLSPCRVLPPPSQAHRLLSLQARTT